MKIIMTAVSCLLLLVFASPARSVDFPDSDRKVSRDEIIKQVDKMRKEAYQRLQEKEKDRKFSSLVKSYQWEIIYFAMVAVLVLMVGRISRKAGFSRWWGLAILAPPLNIMIIWALAIVPWPNLNHCYSPQGGKVSHRFRWRYK